MHFLSVMFRRLLLPLHAPAVQPRGNNHGSKQEQNTAQHPLVAVYDVLEMSGARIVFLQFLLIEFRCKCPLGRAQVALVGIVYFHGHSSHGYDSPLRLEKV